MRILIFILWITTGNTFGQSFTELGQGFTEAGEGGIDWGDFDQDGDLDFAVTGFDAKVYLNNDGVFSPGQKLNFFDNGSPRDNFNHGNVQLADLNNDGYPDILVSGWTGSSEMTRIFVNNGSGMFSTNYQLKDAGGRYSLARDLNNDNLLDVIHVDYNFIKIFRNNGGLVFDLVFADAASVSDNYFVDTGDLDNDGKTDLFLTTKEQFRVYKNAGAFAFSQVGNVEFAMPSTDASISALDYNKDGLLDLVTAGYGPAAAPIYYGSKSTVALDSANNLIGNVSRGSIDWGDCDNDGDPDLVITGMRSTGEIVTEVYNNDNGIFRKNPSLLQGVLYGEAKWGDYDNDGDLDILLWGSEVLKIYRNDLIEAPFVKNTPPKPPSGLSFTQHYDTIILSWADGNDNETSAAGLSYNVSIRRGSEFLVSPNADMNGKLFISGFGNAFSNKEFRIKGLEVGETYEWAVQSIDGGFLASEFSVSSFVYDEPILGIEEEQSEISVYPNPTTGPLKITNATSERLRLTLTDDKGRRLKPHFLSNDMLDLKDFSSGTYILNVFYGSRTKTFMVIKN